MKEILLTSEVFVKSVSNISDNVSGKYLLPAIRETQEIGLKRILGQALLNKLKWCVENNAFRGAFSGEDYNEDYATTRGGNPQYHELLDRCQYYLAYKSISELAYKVSYKIGNVGVVKTSDENIQNASLAEMSTTKEYYASKADYYAKDIQGYLLDNRQAFPELTENKLHEIHSCLYSSASCGLWLGGARGKSYGHKKTRG